MRQTHKHIATAALSDITLPGPDTTTKQAALLNPDPRLDFMLREAAKCDWPNGFSDDLYLRDCKWLAEHPNEPVLWVLRENGTQLYSPVCDSPGGAKYVKDVIKYWSGEDNLNFAPDQTISHCFYITTERIKKISHKQAIDMIRVKPDFD